MTGASLYRSALGALAAAASTSAWAHSGHADHELSFTDGLLHPFTGFDHLALLACGGAILALAQPRIALSRSSMLGLTGVFTCGLGVMMGSIPFTGIGLCAATAGFARSAQAGAHARTMLVLVGTLIAVMLQAGSHLLAWGDVAPSLAFAAGFGLSSLMLFCLAGLLTRAGYAFAGTAEASRGIKPQ